jgi:hypothetical protein
VIAPDTGQIAVERPIGQPVRDAEAAAIPAYLREVYGWAYLNRANARLLDRDAVVSAILLGNNRRLRRALIREIAAGQRVLHVAHVWRAARCHRPGTATGGAVPA